MKFQCLDDAVIKTPSCLCNIIESIQLIRFQSASFDSTVINFLVLLLPLDQLLTFRWRRMRTKSTLT